MSPDELKTALDDWFVECFYNNGQLFSEQAFAHCQDAKQKLGDRLAALLEKEV